MSYRHSSYRKVKRAAKRMRELNVGTDGLPRHESDRLRHWTDYHPRPKPPGWGRPKGWRAVHT